MVSQNSERVVEALRSLASAVACYLACPDGSERNYLVEQEARARLVLNDMVPAADAGSTDPASLAAQRLREAVAEIERLQEVLAGLGSKEMRDRYADERKEIQTKIRDQFAAAERYGFDPAALKEVLRLRKMPANDRHAFQALVAMYQHALGDCPP